MIIALELGLLYAIMALGVYLTYRVLDFPDLTVDGSFTTGASVAAVMIIAGVHPILASLAAVVAGMAAGTVTGLLHTAGRINPLLAGILTQIALYSINLRIMGKANLPLLRQTTIFTPLRENDLIGTWVSVGILALLVTVVMLVLDWFLATDIGVALRATGDNEPMARSQGISTERVKVYGLAISNGLVGGCGALVAQFQGFADISMGIGLIVAGLASVIVGQAIFGSRTVWIATLAVVLGSVIYRGVIQVALNVGFNPNDMKLISAVLVVVAMVLPRWAPLRHWRSKRRARRDASVAGEVAV
ncbi:MAG TPA: ABC transporter permease [Propionibacteriaceae bacterium]|nr:ABC transporter permease [Propionibacteriaceae bacterium]